MTNPTESMTGSSLAAFAVRDKSKAFRAASRHSRRVKVLRRATIGGAAAFVAAIVFFTLFNPFGGAVHGVSIEGASLSGTKVTMANPRLSGYHKDGRPYTITASSAVQDIKVPTVFELHDMQAQLMQADKSMTTLTAATGVYNSAEETMQLTSAVHIVGTSGLDMHAQDARIGFKTSTVTTDKPVTVVLRGNSVAADRMQAVDGGQHVTFEGHVHSVVVEESAGNAVVAASGSPAP